MNTLAHGLVLLLAIAVVYQATRGAGRAPLVLPALRLFGVLVIAVAALGALFLFVPWALAGPAGGAGLP